MPTVIINWYCVCDKTTGGACQKVTYEAVAPQNTASSPIPCPVVSTLPPTTATTTTTTPATTTTTARRQTPSIPLLSLLDIQLSSKPNGSRIALKRFGASCYMGPLYKPELQVAHFIDCCSVCCAYTSCLGVNFLPASQECDLVFENVTATSSPLLSTMADCSFWKVIYRS
ncbi:unnamed protein product [Lymnaea stagnalis]|uniref:Apple domain-containing protein n=1 Tax=Lymnaea stagnalis TaxID=6523 RepID=A0AAV2IP40_LYMST